MNKYRGDRKRYFLNLLSLPGLYFFLLKNIFQQKNFIPKVLERELQPFQDNDGSLKNEDFRKIKSYYGLGVPGILGVSLGVLRGKQLTFKERACLTYLGGISGMLDDLFDDPEKDALQLKELVFDPEKTEGFNSFERLLLHLYNKGLSFAPCVEEIKLQALKVFEAQQQSVLQNSATSQSLIRDITFAKGGSSFIFYRTCMEHQLKKPEEKLLYQIGGVMQLGNDIFDVWEDFQNGINTVATNTKDVQKLKEIFTTELKVIYELAYQTSFPKAQISKFLQLTTLALARVYVCLDQFEKLQNKNGNFLVKNFQRKQLICDMQKPVNQMKAIKYFLDSPPKKGS